MVYGGNDRPISIQTKNTKMDLKVDRSIGQKERKKSMIDISGSV